MKAGLQGDVNRGPGQLFVRKLTDGVALGVGLTILVVVARRQQLAVFDYHGADLGVLPGGAPALGRFSERQLHELFV